MFASCSKDSANVAFYVLWSVCAWGLAQLGQDLWKNGEVGHFQHTSQVDLCQYL
jgi:hypothetical protein